MMTDLMSIKSLGETALIGTLYNARNLEFINYLRLFDFTKLPKHVIQSIPIQHSFQKTYSQDTYSKKFELININGDLALKIICSPESIKGSHTRFVNYSSRMNKNFTKNFTLISHITVNETVNLIEVNEYYKENKITLNKILFEGATHLLVGVTWGLNVIILNENGKYETIADVSNLNTKFNTYFEMNEFTKTIPNLLEKINDGKGVQLEFHLASLDKIKKIFQFDYLVCERVFNQSDDAFYEKCFEIFQDLVICKQKCPIIYSNEKLLKKEKNLKKKFYSKLVEIRTYRYFNGNSLDLALKQIETLKDDYALDFYNKAADLMIKKNYLQSLQHNDISISMNQLSSDAYCQRGHILFNMNNLNEALASYNTSLELNPSNSQALKYKGILLFDLKNYDQSLSLFEQAIELDSNDSDLFNNKALIYDYTNKHEEAIQFFDKALSINPNLIHTLNNKGILLNKLRRFSEAIDCFDKALAIDSTYAEFYNNKGLALYSLNKINESLFYFNKAINIDPSLIIANNYKGICLFKLNKHEEAIQSFDNAIKVWPQNIDALIYKAECLADLHKYSEAVKCCKIALKIDSNHSYAENYKLELEKKKKRRKQFLWF